MGGAVAEACMCACVWCMCVCVFSGYSSRLVSCAVLSIQKFC